MDKPENRCEVCGELRINAETGSVCPFGHGKLHPFNDTKENRRAMRGIFVRTIGEARELPIAVADTADGFTNKKLYALAGHEGCWRRVSRSGSGIRVNRANAALAMLGDGLAEFVRFGGLDAELVKLGYTAPPMPEPPKPADTQTSLLPEDPAPPGETLPPETSDPAPGYVQGGGEAPQTAAETEAAEAADGHTAAREDADNDTQDADASNGGDDDAPGDESDEDDDSARDEGTQGAAQDEARRRHAHRVGGRFAPRSAN
jgi:hypothetical protein